MERVKVDRVLSCSSGGEIALWVNCKVGVITFISKEQRNAGGSTRSVIV
jgi:hypothetical protein